MLSQLISKSLLLGSTHLFKEFETRYPGALILSAVSSAGNIFGFQQKEKHTKP